LISTSSLKVYTPSALLNCRPSPVVARMTPALAVSSVKVIAPVCAARPALTSRIEAAFSDWTMRPVKLRPPAPPLTITESPPMSVTVVPVAVKSPALSTSWIA
jgi:hypothetical protein